MSWTVAGRLIVAHLRALLTTCTNYQKLSSLYQMDIFVTKFTFFIGFTSIFFSTTLWRVLTCCLGVLAWSTALRTFGGLATLLRELIEGRGTKELRRQQPKALTPSVENNASARHSSNAAGASLISSLQMRNAE
jgi:hypothetical protein